MEKTWMRPTNTMGSKRIEKTHISFENRQVIYSIGSQSYGHRCGQVTSWENEWASGWL